MNSISDYDIAFMESLYGKCNHFPGGEKVVDGGAFNYGSHVAIRMGLKVAYNYSPCSRELSCRRQTQEFRSRCNF